MKCCLTQPKRWYRPIGLSSADVEAGSFRDGAGIFLSQRIEGLSIERSIPVPADIAHVAADPTADGTDSRP